MESTTRSWYVWASVAESAIRMARGQDVASLSVPLFLCPFGGYLNFGVELCFPTISCVGTALQAVECDGVHDLHHASLVRA